MRLVTHGDLDGLTCAILISTCEDIGEIQLAHPQDITNNRIHLGEEDILANLPYSPGVGKWFDHHVMTDASVNPPEGFEGRYALAPSAARVVYEYYVTDHPQLQRYERLLAETDRLDSANLSLDDVLTPEDYILLGFTLDPRTGLGDYQTYFHKCVTWVTNEALEETLKRPEVTERVERIRKSDEAFCDITNEHSRVEGNVIITDFRELDPPPIGNRFIVYTLFPEANISMRLHWGPNKNSVAAALGHSIFNRTSHTNIGELLGKYGGGGHKGAGTALLPVAKADEQIQELIDAMKQDG